MNANDFDKYISSYLDRELKKADTKEFEQLLDSNIECKKKFEDYKNMLNKLSSINIKASNQFLYKLNDKVDTLQFTDPIMSKTIFGYNYFAISGIVAAVSIFIFSISIFMSSATSPLNMKYLSAKNIEEKLDIESSNMSLVAEDDTSGENDEVDLPKIHLVGSKK